MANLNTTIEWTDATWSPVTGCTKVSAGCKNCYAEGVAKRFWGGGRKFTDVQCHPERLDLPLRWRKPRKVFVNSMSDLFHEDVPGEFINRVFAIMALCPHHTFQILTKRPDRMQRFLSVQGADNAVRGRAWEILGRWPKYNHHDVLRRLWPLPNVWLGVSVEDQAAANERIPLLLATPAAVRFVSAEPLLSAIDLAQSTDQCIFWRNINDPDRRIDWVICGGESGPHARQAHPDWYRSIRDQCKVAGVPFFMKQMGGMKKKTMPQIPEDLMIREYPT